MKKPVIGIIPVYNLTNDANDPYLDNATFVNMYYDLITKNGGIPIGLLDYNNIDDYINMCDGYLWPGGGCIIRYYNRIFDDAINNNKPILGICLGMQAIATYFNVLDDMKITNLSYEDTYQKNKNDQPYLYRLDEQAVMNHNHYVTKDEAAIKAALHDVLIKENTELYKIYQTKQISVPSMHTIAVSRIPSHLKVTANTQDGVIEGMEHIDPNVKILGVQFHPELIQDEKLFKWLIDNAN